MHRYDEHVERLRMRTMSLHVLPVRACGKNGWLSEEKMSERNTTKGEKKRTGAPRCESS